MKTQIYYIHGYGSSPTTGTVEQLQSYFPDCIGLDYDPTDPQNSIKYMVEVIRSTSKDKQVIIVGSSLGGWYAEQLTPYIVGDYILYNPCTNPEIKLKEFGISDEICSKYVSNTPKFLPTSRSVLLSIDDEVIDCSAASIKYRYVADIMYTMGGHRMTNTNMNTIVNKINFLKNQLTI